MVRRRINYDIKIRARFVFRTLKHKIINRFTF